MTSAAGAERTDRATWVRLGAALLIGVGALVVPAVVPHAGHTGAVYTDREQTSADFHAGPTDAPTTDPTTDPTATGTTPPPAEGTTTAPASLANLAGLASQGDARGAGAPGHGTGHASTHGPGVDGATHGSAGHASQGRVPGGQPSGAHAAGDQ
jgi:hypothetical protein